MKSQKGGFRVAKPEKTKEQIEYDEAAKNVKLLTVRLRLSQQGVDTSSVSRQELDRIVALYDRMDTISADVRNKTSEIQRDSNADIQRINQKANEKYSQVSKDIDIIINKMKNVEKVVDSVKAEQAEQIETGKEDIKEEIIPDISQEKIREGIINYFTDRITQKVKKEVISAFEDYMNIPQTTIGQGVINKEVTQEIAIEAGHAAVEESKKAESAEMPDSKDIQAITPEMMENTEEDVN